MTRLTRVLTSHAARDTALFLAFFALGLTGWLVYAA